MSVFAMYTWAKVFHVLFVVSWFACLFYLPRILVNLAEIQMDKSSSEVQDRLLLMGRRLARFSHVMMGLALLSGLILWLGFQFKGGWLHAKLMLVLILVGYQVICGRMLKKFSQQKNHFSAYSLRWFNEIPVLFLLCILILVFFKPI
jgi:putative membrane protein